MSTLRIPAAWCGPPGSANGGVTAGLLAGHVAAADGVRLLDGARLVAEARAGKVGADPPPAVAYDEALRVAPDYPGLTARLVRTPDPGERCVVVGRLLERHGRKAFTATAGYDESGRLLGHAEATWVALRDRQADGARAS